jgi:hypothetical protein
MPSRRLNDRIAELCGMVARADGPEVKAIAEELRAALREQSERLRTRLSVPFIERRTYIPPSLNHDVGYQSEDKSNRRDRS